MLEDVEKDASANHVQPQPDECVSGAETLNIGQIIRARIPTIFDGEIRIFERDCIVIGFEGMPKAGDKATGVYLARLNHNPQKFTADYGHVVEAMDFRAMGINGDIGSFVLRTDRVDLLPIEPFFLGSKIKTVGFINNHETMMVLGDEIIKGLASEGAEAGRGPRTRLEGSEARQTYMHGAEPVFRGFKQAAIARAMTKLRRGGSDDYERALHQVSVQLMQQAATAGYIARKNTREKFADAATERPARTPKLEYITRADILKRRRRMSTQRADQIVSRHNARVRRNREEAGLEIPRDPGHIRGNAIAETQPKYLRKSKSMTNGHSARPLFSIATNYTPILPHNIRRGDVIVLKIADIQDTKDKRPAQRPCVVWNVYQDRETGEICGLDVFPRTRLRAHEFDAALSVELPNLYNNRIWDGGRILVQKIARLPLTPEFFHPSTKRVRALNPALAQEILDKRNAIEASQTAITPYGLVEIPENWVLRDTPLDEPNAGHIAHAEHIHDHLERHKPALEGSPNVGDVIMRKVRRDNEIIEVPSLIWGVWHNKVTGFPAAFECVNLVVPDRHTRAWCHALPLEEDGAQLVADLTHIDLLYNTEKFFTPGKATHCMTVTDDDMKKMDAIRSDVLVNCGNRRGFYPEFMPFDWERVDGPTYGHALSRLKSRKFAPDLAECQDPGYLKHRRRRDDNRKGLPPRRKREGFKPKRAPV